MTPTPGAIRAATTLYYGRVGIGARDWAEIIDQENEPLLIAARGILHVLTHDAKPETVDAAVALLRKEMGE